MSRPKEFKKSDVLLKAMKIFWDKGYEGTSISDLTEKMNISRSSLYETFGDKHELFIEALEFYLSMTHVKKNENFSKAKNVKIGMYDFFKNAIDFILNEVNPGGCFYTNTVTSLAMTDKKVKTILQKNLEKQENDFFDYLEKGKQKGEIMVTLDTRQLARYFVALLRGITVIARIKKDRIILEDIVNVGMKVLN